MAGSSIGDDPQIREALNELRDLIELAENAPWTATEARTAIESLRQGIPPVNAAVALTVGRESVLARITHDLDDVRYGKSRLLILKGVYGMGKTHTLRVFQQFAHQQDFASSLIELSPRECPLSDLGIVYKNVVRNLSTQSDNAGLDLPALLEKWRNHVRAIGENDRKKALNQFQRLDHDFRGALTAYFEDQSRADKGLSSTVLDWISGEKLSVREQASIGVSSSVSQDNALSMLGNLGTMLRCIGLKGVVILFDEADRILSFDDDAIRGKTIRNLNLLMRSAAEFPSSCFVYSTPPSFFEQRDVVTGIDLKPRNIVELGPLERRHLRDLAGKIRDLHLIAYSWEDSSRVRDSKMRLVADQLLEHKLLQSSVRGFVRANVEVLDSCQQDNNLTLGDVVNTLNTTLLVS